MGAIVVAGRTGILSERLRTTVDIVAAAAAISGDGGNYRDRPRAVRGHRFATSVRSATTEMALVCSSRSQLDRSLAGFLIAQGTVSDRRTVSNPSEKTSARSDIRLVSGQLVGIQRFIAARGHPAPKVRDDGLSRASLRPTRYSASPRAASRRAVASAIADVAPMRRIRVKGFRDPSPESRRARGIYVGRKFAPARVAVAKQHARMRESFAGYNRPPAFSTMSSSCVKSRSTGAPLFGKSSAKVTPMRGNESMPGDSWVPKRLSTASEEPWPLRAMVSRSLTVDCRSASGIHTDTEKSPADRRADSSAGFDQAEKKKRRKCSRR